jgi:hypothetical protein
VVASGSRGFRGGQWAPGAGLVDDLGAAVSKRVRVSGVGVDASGPAVS